MSVRVSLHGMLRLIRVDTLGRFHNVGFLVRRLKWYRDGYGYYLQRQCETQNGQMAASLRYCMIPINSETCLLNRLHMVTIPKLILESACLASEIGFSDVCNSDRFHYILFWGYFWVNSCVLITNSLSLYKNLYRRIIFSISQHHKQTDRHTFRQLCQR